MGITRSVFFYGLGVSGPEERPVNLPSNGARWRARALTASLFLVKLIQKAGFLNFIDEAQVPVVIVAQALRRRQVQSRQLQKRANCVRLRSQSGLDASGDLFVGVSHNFQI